MALFASLFVCAHRSVTFPQSPRGRSTYIVCLDCGKQAPYDWDRMQPGVFRSVGGQKPERRMTYRTKRLAIASGACLAGGVVFWGAVIWAWPALRATFGG